MQPDSAVGVDMGVDALPERREHLHVVGVHGPAQSPEGFGIAAAKDRVQPDSRREPASNARSLRSSVCGVRIRVSTAAPSVPRVAGRRCEEVR